MDFKPSVKAVVSAVESVLEPAPVPVDLDQKISVGKFVILTFRKYTDLEWDTFEKFGLHTYEYSKSSAAGLDIDGLFAKYDVVIIDPNKDESLQFWNLAKLKFPRDDAWVVALVNKRRSDCEVTRYGIQSQVKKLYDAKDSTELINSLIAGTLKAPQSIWVEAGKKLIDFVLSLLPLVSKK